MMLMLLLMMLMLMNEMKVNVYVSSNLGFERQQKRLLTMPE